MDDPAAAADQSAAAADAAVVIADLTGETVVKEPGSINGESVSIKNLTDCKVYLLDFSSEVEVSNCRGCTLVVGPVDGPAIFDALAGCRVAAACQQFQARGCADCEVQLYCATGPALAGCARLRVSGWALGYPGLPAHFAAANLDPAQNQFANIYDAPAPGGGDGGGDGAPSYELAAAAPGAAWALPALPGAGPAENPVPPPPAVGGAAGAAAAAPLDDAFFGGGGGEPAAEAEAGGGFGAPEGGAPPAATAAMRAATAERMARQAKEEAAGKAKAQEAARAFLADFAERRARARAERSAAAEAAAAEAGPRGATEWERAASLIDFSAARPSGSDLARFKAVMAIAKGKGAAGGGGANGVAA